MENRKIYRCLVCGWVGKKPIHSHQDSGWLACPNECIDKNGDLEIVKEYNYF